MRAANMTTLMGRRKAWTFSTEKLEWATHENPINSYYIHASSAGLLVSRTGFWPDLYRIATGRERVMFKSVRCQEDPSDDAKEEKGGNHSSNGRSHFNKLRRAFDYTTTYTCWDSRRGSGLGAERANTLMGTL